MPHRLVTRKNAGHVWLDIAKDVALLADWFDKYLSATGDRTGNQPPPTAASEEPLKLLPPQPLVPGAKVVTLWPAGSPMLKALDGWDKPEVFNRSKDKARPGRFGDEHPQPVDRGPPRPAGQGKWYGGDRCPGRRKHDLRRRHRRR